MAIEPYKQSLTHSCLAACFLMLLQEQKGIEFDSLIEQDICLKGSQRSYPFYVVGLPVEIAKTFHIRIQVLVDNKYFAGILSKAFNKKSFDVEHQKITILLLKKLLQQGPLICHIDDHFIGNYSHASHFIVLEKCRKNNIVIIDPYTGKRKLMKDVQLNEAIQSLKKRIKMCPLLFRMTE